MARVLVWILVGALAGCGDDDDSGRGDSGLPGADGGDAGGDGGATAQTQLFEVWAELRERIQRSPDHLPQRANEVVATGDANAIFEFVRDEIAVVPKSAGGDFTGPGWGSRATLRAGVGTAHDKVRVLADLFERAGFSTRVGAVIHDFDQRDATPVFSSSPNRTFAPPITSEDIARWQEMLGVDALPPSTLRVVDTDGSTARAWADSIRAAITPNDPFAPPAELDTFIPAVEVDIDGTLTAANPIFPDAMLGETYANGPTVNVRDWGPYEDVSVRLWARRNHTDNPDEDITLVEQTFTMDQVAGRRVVVRTPPILDFRELILVRPEDIGTFLPVIELTGDGVDDSTQMAVNAAGTPINPRGERLEVTDDGDLLIEGTAFPVDENESGTIARVASLDVEADPESFPEIRLTVDARDSDGESVEGLSGRAFEVEEEGERMFHMMRRNTARTRVQLLFDFSLSVPPEFQGENAIQLGLDIARDVLMQPGGQVSAAVVGNSAYQPWTSDLVEFEAQLRSVNGNSSALWTQISGAQARDPDLIILVSDGSPDDMDTPERRDAITRGSAPVIVLRTPPGPVDISAELAMITGGQVVPVTDRTAAASAIGTYLAGIDNPAYEIRYRAPESGPTTRNVRAGIAGTAVEGTTSYDAPDDGAGVYGMTGLYLTVNVDGDEVTRVLAGAPLDRSHREPTDADVETVAEALLGTYVVGFEGAPPPFSVVLDEWLADELTLRDIYGARGSFEDWVMAMEAGHRQPVPELISTAALASYDSTASHTFVARPRPVIVSRKPVWGEGYERRVDILPTTPWATMGPAPADAWGATVERSLHLAAVESDLYAMSTGSLLAGETLEAIEARDLVTRFGGMPLESRWEAAAQPFLGFGEYSALVPSDGDPVAFWAVHNDTGSVLGVIEDGSGGTYERIRARVERNLAFFDMLESAADAGGISGGVWLSLELAKARIVSWATLWIGSLGEPGIEPPPGVEEVEDMVAEWIRSELEGHALDALPAGWSDAISDAMEVMGLVSDAAGLSE